MKRILICSTILTTVKTFLIPHIKMLQDMEYIVDVAGHKDVNDLDRLVNNVYDIPFKRNPFSKSNIIASKKLKQIVQSNKYDIIHFHTPVASAFGRWAVRGYRKNGTKVFYTAHGFHFYKGAPLRNWLIYYPVEKLLSRYTDLIITLNNEDYSIASKLFKAKNIEYVPGVGFNHVKFNKEGVNKSAKRTEIGVPDGAFVLLSVGELNKNKNHEVVLKAIPELTNKNVLYLICGKGEREVYLKQLTILLGISNKVKFLGFREDVADIYKASDCFVFPSYREGLSVSLMEAMAAGLPVVCSKIRGNTDLISEGVGGFVVRPNDAQAFAEKIDKVISDTELQNKMSYQNIELIKRYELTEVKEKMRKFYLIY